MIGAILVVLFGVSAAALVGTARADGGPSAAESAGLAGIVTPTGFRYVVIDSPETSVLVRIAPAGRVVAMKHLPGRFAIPAVAYDGTPTGLSADGKTLVLVQPRSTFPRKRTRFLVLSTPGMFVRQDVVLEGDFTADAISPDGSMLYFVQYLSRKDPGRYAVRAYDREGGRLVPEPVVDRSEPDEEMRGSPISRVTSGDGRWAYTLYDGGGGTPFVHALDTVAVEAHCIDLAELAGRDDLVRLRLRLRGGGSVAVVNDKRPLLMLDRATFQVSKPETGSVSHSDGSTPWAPIGAGAGALIAAGALSLTLLRRRRPAAT